MFNIGCGFIIHEITMLGFMKYPIAGAFEYGDYLQRSGAG